MKKPTIRVAKWLGDIPVEAGCGVCTGVVFRAEGSGHRPNPSRCPRRSLVSIALPASGPNGFEPKERTGLRQDD